jgi:hypothetical protein
MRYRTITWRVAIGMAVLHALRGQARNGGGAARVRRPSNSTPDAREKGPVDYLIVDHVEKLAEN